MSLVRTERVGSVAHVILDRPDKRNALSAALASDLRDALDEVVGSEPRPRCVVLRGAGPVFCAGGDLDAMRERVGQPDVAVDALRSYLSPTIMAVADLPVPTIAAVHGAAVGAGLGLALACDHVLVTEDAGLSAGQSNVGLAPDGGVSFFLPRLVGLRAAIDLVQTGRRVTGLEAVDMGLVNTAHADEAELLAAAARLAELMAERPTRALVLARGLLRRNARASLVDALEHEAKAQGVAYGTRDVAEALEARDEGRDPEFEGR